MSPGAFVVCSVAQFPSMRKQVVTHPECISTVSHGPSNLFFMFSTMFSMVPVWLDGTMELRFLVLALGNRAC
jgi:hypothetical protein